MDHADDSTPTTFMPIDVTGGDQPILAGLTPLVPGALIASRYRLVRPCGRLGTASRWEATDESLSRPVMILAFADDEHAPSILEAARQASGAMDARFLRILDAGQDADGAYVVSEWLKGRTLTELLARGPLSPIEAAWTVREVASGLASTHSLRLYHLRLNPTDILITDTGAVKIAGLMVEAALTENNADQGLTRSSMEQADVVGCGRLLYACLTATWPGDPTPGIESTPRTGASLPTPVQIHPSASLELNKVTYRILSPAAPDHLTSAEKVVDTLSESLGSASGATSLAHRVIQSPEPPLPSSGVAERPTILPQRNTTYPAQDSGANATTHLGQTAESELTEVIGEATPFDNDSSPDSGLPTQHIGSTAPSSAPLTGVRSLSQTQVRRWSIGLIILASLVTLTIVSTVVIALYKSSLPPVVPPLVDRPVSQAIVFDPTADGGNATENEDLVSLSFDGDPTTVWPTAEYNPGYITNTKPGVGLIFDLGESVSISQITVQATILPTSVTLYFPPDSSVEPAQLPMETIASWTPGSTVALDTSPVTAEFSPTTTRYVLVYITHLNLGENGKDHGDLAEVSFSGR